MSARTAFLPCAITRLAFVNNRFAFERLSLSVPSRSSFAILSFSYGAMTATITPSHRGHRIFAGRSRTISRQDILQFRQRNVAVSFSRRAFTAIRVAWSALDGVTRSPPQERRVLQDHAQEWLEGIRVLRAKDLDDLLRVHGPGHLEDDPVRIRLHPDALPEPRADERRDELREGLVDLRSEARVHDQDVPRGLNRDAGVG